MRVFAIGDLHLSGSGQKPMDVFGPQWAGHFEKIAASWRELVGKKDTVLIPGDISWAMRFEEAADDLEQIHKLPGNKILLKGNHDFWWSSITRIRAMLPEGMYALQHDAVDIGELVVCGTRGWLIPTENEPFQETDRKIYGREIQRLSLALSQARSMAKTKPIVLMTHFPPINESGESNEMTEMIREYGVKTVVYGHLHGDGIRMGFTGEAFGTYYMLASCDSIDFRPIELKITM